MPQCKLKVASHFGYQWHLFQVSRSWVKPNSCCVSVYPDRRPTYNTLASAILLMFLFLNFKVTVF